MPNLHQIAQGKELHTLFIMTWVDNVGGNISKLVTTFKNLYFGNVNLPGHLFQQECFVHMVATSQHASTLEQFKAFSSESHVNPIQTYYAHMHHMCWFQLTIPGLLADNPHWAEQKLQMSVMSGWRDSRYH
ncbi:hypothetical protein K439DRAFT_1352648 [Ramaria rubella]|nr:hypothetical protein K439DRAFT_1352648 [Ramaria rubella]